MQADPIKTLLSGTYGPGSTSKTAGFSNHEACHNISGSHNVDPKLLLSDTDLTFQLLLDSDSNPNEHIDAFLKQNFAEQVESTPMNKIKLPNLCI